MHFKATYGELLRDIPDMPSIEIIKLFTIIPVTPKYGKIIEHLDKINKDYMLYDKDDDDIIHYYTNFSFDPHHEGFEIDELPNLCIFELDMYDMMEAMTILAMHMEFGTPTVDNAPCLPGNQDITLYLDGEYEDYVTIVFMFNNHPELDIFRVQPRNISSFIELNSHLFQ